MSNDHVHPIMRSIVNAIGSLGCDETCATCGKEFPTPMRTRYVCCNGADCGCYGATLPDDFCSVACYENYDPTPYCSSCGAMRKSDCDCGPLADNE